VSSADRDCFGWQWNPCRQVGGPPGAEGAEEQEQEEQEQEQEQATRRSNEHPDLKRVVFSTHRNRSTLWRRRIVVAWVVVTARNVVRATETSGNVCLGGTGY
jgi:hypothetical protein